MVTRILKPSTAGYQVFFGADVLSTLPTLSRVPGLGVYPTAKAALQAYKEEYKAPKAEMTKQGLVLPYFEA